MNRPRFVVFLDRHMGVADASRRREEAYFVLRQFHQDIGLTFSLSITVILGSRLSGLIHSGIEVIEIDVFTKGLLDTVFIGQVITTWDLCQNRNETEDGEHVLLSKS